MRFGRRTRNWAAVGRRLLGERPESGLEADAGDGAVITEERDALLDAALEESDMVPPEEEQEVTVDPTQRLLTALGRFQRQVARAEGGAAQEDWCDECMNQLIAGIEIALEEDWTDVQEALTDTARILQTYEYAGRAGDCVPFLQDCYELLCLMVGDLIVDNARSGVMQKWRALYQSAVDEVMRAGLTLIEDAGPPEESAEDENEPEEQEAQEDPFGEASPFDTPEAVSTASEEEEAVPEDPFGMDEPAEGDSESFDALLDAAPAAAAEELEELDPDDAESPALEEVMSEAMGADPGNEEPALEMSVDEVFASLESSQDLDAETMMDEATPFAEAPEGEIVSEISQETLMDLGAETEGEPDHEAAPEPEVEAGAEAPEASPVSALESLFDEEPEPEPEPEPAAAPELELAVEPEPELAPVVAAEPAPAPEPEPEEPAEGTPEALLRHASAAMSRGDVADAKVVALELAASMADLEVDRARDSLCAAEEELARNNAAIETAKQAVSDADASLQAAEEGVAARQADIAAKREEIDGLRGELDGVRREVADLEEQIRALEAKRDERQQAAESLDTRLDEATAEEGRLNTEAEELSEQENTCRETLGAAESELAALHEERRKRQDVIFVAERNVAARRASAEGIRQTIAAVVGTPAEADQNEDGEEEKGDGSLF